MMMSLTNDVTTAANVTPMMNATANCSRFPRSMNALKSFSMRASPSPCCFSSCGSAILPGAFPQLSPRSSYPQAPVSDPDASCQ